MKVYRVAGYVKLAKLWERSREQAIKYHNEYYRNKFLDVPEMDLVDVFIDITGSKHMRNRPQMIRLIAECMAGRVDCIATQTVPTWLQIMRICFICSISCFCWIRRYIL